MSKVTLKVNGTTHSLDIEPSTPLLYILRNDLDLHGPRFGCGLGQCEFHVFEGCEHEWVAKEGPQTERARAMVKAFIARQLKRL